MSDLAGVGGGWNLGSTVCPGCDMEGGGTDGGSKRAGDEAHPLLAALGGAGQLLSLILLARHSSKFRK